VTQPLRLQRSRAKGSRLVSPDGRRVVYCGRPGPFANPFTVAKFGEYWAGLHFIRWLLGSGWRDFEQERRRELIRRLPSIEDCHLSCWCALPPKGKTDGCHAAVYLRLFGMANTYARLRAEVEKNARKGR